MNNSHIINQSQFLNNSNINQSTEISDIIKRHEEIASNIKKIRSQSQLPYNQTNSYRSNYHQVGSNANIQDEEVETIITTTTMKVSPARNTQVPQQYFRSNNFQNSTYPNTTNPAADIISQLQRANQNIINISSDIKDFNDNSRRSQIMSNSYLNENTKRSQVLSNSQYNENTKRSPITSNSQLNEYPKRTPFMTSSQLNENPKRSQPLSNSQLGYSTYSNNNSNTQLPSPLAGNQAFNYTSHVVTNPNNSSNYNYNNNFNNNYNDINANFKYTPNTNNTNYNYTDSNNNYNLNNNNNYNLNNNSNYNLNSNSNYNLNNNSNYNTNNNNSYILNNNNYQNKDNLSYGINNNNGNYNLSNSNTYNLNNNSNYNFNDKNNYNNNSYNNNNNESVKRSASVFNSRTTQPPVNNYQPLYPTGSSQNNRGASQNNRGASQNNRGASQTRVTEIITRTYENEAPSASISKAANSRTNLGQSQIRTPNNGTQNNISSLSRIPDPNQEEDDEKDYVKRIYVKGDGFEYEEIIDEEEPSNSYKQLKDAYHDEWVRIDYIPDFVLPFFEINQQTKVAATSMSQLNMSQVSGINQTGRNPSHNQFSKNYLEESFLKSQAEATNSYMNSIPAYKPYLV